MKGILGLAAEFLDGLTDPARSVEEHELHAARFAELLARDPQLGELLTGSDLGAADVDLLSTAAWLWYLTWLRSSGVGLPGPAFLDALFDSTGDHLVRLKIVEAAATDATIGREDRGPGGRPPGDSQAWLTRRIRRLATAEDGEQAFEEANDFALYLLQVGNDTAQEYLRDLLARDGPHRDSLRRSVIQILENAAAAGDGSEMERWRDELGL